jgi:hypothetical protein
VVLGQGLEGLEPLPSPLLDNEAVDLIDTVVARVTPALAGSGEK